MRYTRKKQKQKQKQKKATRKRMKGGLPWSKPRPQPVLRANTARYGRNIRCTDMMKSPEIIEFIKKYIVNATIRRVKRYNLSLQDLKTTPVKFMDLESSPFFNCIPQDMQKSAETCILNYQSHGRLLVDTFSSTTTPDDIRLIIKSLSAPCAPVVAAPVVAAPLAAAAPVVAAPVAAAPVAAPVVALAVDNNDDNHYEVESDWRRATRDPLNVASPVQPPTLASCAKVKNPDGGS